MEATLEKAIWPLGDGSNGVKPGGGAAAFVSAADGDLNTLELLFVFEGRVRWISSSMELIWEMPGKADPVLVADPLNTLFLSVPLET